MDVWTEILSQKITLIWNAYERLNEEEKIAVHAHLIKTTTEEGWHPEQARSAQIALNTIKEIP